MYSVEDIKSCTQESFAECIDTVDVVKTYSEILKETEKQMEFMIEQYSKTNKQN
ncbi:hypothetical protein K413DRAFT_3382 [Clostridium sp. ASBs410]|nr:hypothetical protein K413DRAFT_3382 [Clostridium sp. ASBs410]